MTSATIQPVDDGPERQPVDDKPWAPTPSERQLGKTRIRMIRQQLADHRAGVDHDDDRERDFHRA